MRHNDTYTTVSYDSIDKVIYLEVMSFKKWLTDTDRNRLKKKRPNPDS